MSDYDNTNRGALFVNDNKETDNHPDFTGTINVGGQEFWLSAWKKVSAKDVHYLSLSVKPKEARPASRSREEANRDGRKARTDRDPW